MFSQFFTISATVWNNYIVIIRGGHHGIVFDPLSSRCWRLPKSHCQHPSCELKATGDCLTCVGFPLTSSSSYDLAKNLWIRDKISLPPNLCTCFYFDKGIH